MFLLIVQFIFYIALAIHLWLGNNMTRIAAAIASGIMALAILLKLLGVS